MKMEEGGGDSENREGGQSSRGGLRQVIQFNSF